MKSEVPIKDKITRHLLVHNSRKLRLGVGCAWFARQEDYRDTLEHDLGVLMGCYEAGFRYYDTSRQYGNSEQAVGEMVKRVPRETIYLATKSALPYIEGSYRRNFQQFKDHFHQSFNRLQTDHIDLFQIHDTEHYECCVNEAIPFLQEKRKEGLISYIGMATRSLNVHELAVRAGNVESVLSYLNYSLLKKSASHVISLCQQAGTAFVNAAIFHYGLLAAADPMKHHAEYNLPHLARNRATAAAMQALCAKLGIPILAAALQVSLLNPGIDMTLVGIKTPEDLESTFAELAVSIYPEQWAEIFALQERQLYLYIQDDLLA